MIRTPAVQHAAPIADLHRDFEAQQTFFDGRRPAPESDPTFGIANAIDNEI